MNLVTRWISAAFAAASIFSFGAAQAAIMTCPTGGSGVTITLTTSTAATCSLSGNGNNITGSSDVINALGFQTLDTTATSGLVTLAFSGTTSGSFSFTGTGFTDFVLGFQTSTGQPQPDYFSFNLPGGVTSGTWTLNNRGDDTVTRAVLYGHTVPVPGPIVGAGLPGLVFAGGGFLAWWRRKRKAADVAV